jgi:uncharacterized membrane protein YcaP (DUF421 family)
LNEAIVVFVRGIIGFFTLLILTSFLGKQEISQLTFFDYVLGITIGSIAASLTTDLSSMAWPHWLGLLTWTGAVLIMQLITLKWRHAAKYLEGEPTVVIMNGKIMENAMRKMKYRANDLMEQLRIKGVFDLAQVEFAILETNGQLSVQKKAQHQPVTPKDLNIPTSYSGISTELIYDGVIFDQNLRQVNLDRGWLQTELKKRGINDPSEVFLALLNTHGELYIDKYKDHIRNSTDIGDYPGPQ